MSTTAESTRHLRTLRHDKKTPWHWTALCVGHVQPRGYRTYRKSRWFWQFHVTPVHVSRYGDRCEAHMLRLVAGTCSGCRADALAAS